MVRDRVATALTLLLSGGIITIGTGYVRGSHAVIDGFGVPGWAAVPGPAYEVKGVRDVMSGLVPLTLLALRQRRALGFVLAVEAVVPVGDMVTVLRHGGSRATAVGVHGSTAAAMLVTARLLLGRR